MCYKKQQTGKVAKGPLNKEKTLLKNTVMLYIITFSSYFFNFITVPYQTRILGPEIYGNLGFAQAFASYFQLVLDFGFLLSATAEVSRNREDKQTLSRIMTAILICKGLLTIICLTAATGLCLTVPRFRGDIPLYVLCILAALANSFLPDYLYRGLEKMSLITYRTVGVRLFFMVAIFLTLKTSDQYYLVPILNLCGAVAACAWAYFDVGHRLGIKTVSVSFQYVMQTMRASAEFFFSRVATTLYGATNTFVLGFVYPAGSPVIGYYTSSDKLLTAARGALSPISDSLYPYMVVNKDFKLVKKVLIVLMPLIVLGCTVVGIFAEPFCAILLGEEYREVGSLLRLILPLVVLALPVYLCGFPVLTALNKARYANLSVIIASGVHMLQIVVLLVTKHLTAESVCVATVITECVVFGIRLYAIFSARREKGASALS